MAVRRFALSVHSAKAMFPTFSHSLYISHTSADVPAPAAVTQPVDISQLPHTLVRPPSPNRRSHVLQQQLSQAENLLAKILNVEVDELDALLPTVCWWKDEKTDTYAVHSLVEDRRLDLYLRDGSTVTDIPAALIENRRNPSPEATAARELHLLMTEFASHREKAQVFDRVQPVVIGGETFHLQVIRRNDQYAYAALGKGKVLELVWQAEHRHFVPADVAPALKGKGKHVAADLPQEPPVNKRARLDSDPLLQAAAMSVLSPMEFEQQAAQDGRQMSAKEIIKAHRDALIAKFGHIPGEPVHRYCEQQSVQRCLQQAFNNLWGKPLLELSPMQGATDSDWELIKGVRAGNGAPMRHVELPAWMLPTFMEALLETSHVLIYKSLPGQADDDGRYVGVRRKEDGSHEEIDPLENAPQPVDARRLYEELGRSANALICAVPGGSDCPKALLRYEGWVSRDGYKQVGTALAELLGEERLTKVINHLLLQEERRQQAVSGLPGQEPLPRLPLAEALKGYFENAGNLAQVEEVEFSTMDPMQQIVTKLDACYDFTRQTNALLCMQTPPLLIPVYRDENGQWQARVFNERGGAGMTRRPLNDVMQPQQEAWDGRQREAEGQERQNEAATPRLPAHILTLRYWPVNWPPPNKHYWQRTRERWRYKFENPDAPGKVTSKFSSVSGGNEDGVAKAEALEALQGYQYIFEAVYPVTKSMDKARAAGEAYMKKIGVSLRKPPAVKYKSQEPGVN
jgi:hypothetical protein